MLNVHQRGVGVCGICCYEIAEAKATKVMDYARQNEHPLQLQIEKEQAMLSRELEETLRRPWQPQSANHEFATLEHLLLALTEDSDALKFYYPLDIEELRARLTDFIENELSGIVSPTSTADVQPTASLKV